jgi:hypothetical protein
MNDEFAPIATFYNTREEALISYFGEREIYDLNDYEHDSESYRYYQKLNCMTNEQYYNYLLKHHTYGDGESVQLIFEVNTDTKEVIWVEE